MTSIHNGASSHNGLSSAPQSSAPTWTRATTNFYPSHKRPFLCSWAHSKLPVSNCLLIRDAPVNRVITFGRLLQHDLDAAKSALPHGALLQHPGMVLKGGKGEDARPSPWPSRRIHSRLLLLPSDINTINRNQHLRGWDTFSRSAARELIAVLLAVCATLSFDPPRPSVSKRKRTSGSKQSSVIMLFASN